MGADSSRKGIDPKRLRSNQNDRVCMYVGMQVYTYIYIYIQREREREREISHNAHGTV